MHYYATYSIICYCVHINYFVFLTHAYTQEQEKCYIYQHQVVCHDWQKLSSWYQKDVAQAQMKMNPVAIYCFIFINSTCDFERLM